MNYTGFLREFDYKQGMQLWLIRHGECETNAASDEARLLTPRGLEDVARVAAHVSARAPEFPLALLSSPFRRAQQTAEAFRTHWGLEIETAPWLLPLSGVAAALDELRKRPEERLALVGHMPNLGLLLATLLWGLPPREAVLPRAAAALLELPAWEPGAAQLKLFIKPEEIP
ncbi:MAG: phosphohistidine phosphatase SixA [Deltaproteobacteria bacterium]|nr:phosphohistidine phosphatase SixA [Deltaproteobacteria bacterium]